MILDQDIWDCLKRHTDASCAEELMLHLTIEGYACEIDDLKNDIYNIANFIKTRYVYIVNQHLDEGYITTICKLTDRSLKIHTNLDIMPDLFFDIVKIMWPDWIVIYTYNYYNYFEVTFKDRFTFI